MMVPPSEKQKACLRATIVDGAKPKHKFFSPVEKTHVGVRQVNRSTDVQRAFPSPTLARRWIVHACPSVPVTTMFGNAATVST